ncbi:MAG: SMP-30/gluconolactonase/LRE family protein [Dehalococcoidia bacterium]|nr:SMP-30/gluconolactonase/LRE family protein [Dehalococcoidia bacterium]
MVACAVARARVPPEMERQVPGEFEIITSEFKRILGQSPRLEMIADGQGFSEGTAWSPDGFLVWSDIPMDRMLRWDPKGGVGLFRYRGGNANGNTFDLEGRLLTCETSGRRVSITGRDGSVCTLVDRYQGRKLTSPNDVVVKSDGTVWFTDPDYGAVHPELGHGERFEQTRNRVYRYDPALGELSAVSEDFDKPNGIAFSPDENHLFVGDTGRTHGEFRNHHLIRFEVARDGRSVSKPRVFCVVNPGVPDGFRCDTEGNVYVGAGDGVQVYNKDGELIGKIRTPGAVGNCSFGMGEYDTLFIAASKQVFKLKLNAQGAYRPGAKRASVISRKHI